MIEFVEGFCPGALNLAQLLNCAKPNLWLCEVLLCVLSETLHKCTYCHFCNLKFFIWLQFKESDRKELLPKVFVLYQLHLKQIKCPLTANRHWFSKGHKGRYLVTVSNQLSYHSFKKYAESEFFFSAGCPSVMSLLKALVHWPHLS